MLDPESFNVLIESIQALGYEQETASQFALFIGGTPILDDQGRTLILDSQGHVIARLNLPYEE